MNSTLKPWLILATIFIAGIATGVALTIVLGPQFRHPPGPIKMQGDFMTYLTRKLDLTPDQQAKIQPIVAETAKNIQALHQDEMASGAKIIQASNDKISAFLTPEQKTKLAEMESERKKQFQRHMGNWGPPRDGGGHGFGGPGEPGGPGDMPPPPPPADEPADAGTKAPPAPK